MCGGIDDGYSWGNSVEVKSKAIKVYTDKAYTIFEKIVTEYEAGKIHFEDHHGNRVMPSYFGRSGDGFNATFKMTVN